MSAKNESLFGRIDDFEESRKEALEEEGVGVAANKEEDDDISSVDADADGDDENTCADDNDFGVIGKFNDCCWNLYWALFRGLLIGLRMGLIRDSPVSAMSLLRCLAAFDSSFAF